MMRRMILFFLFVTTFSLTFAVKCNLREYPTGFVCVCNETYCDTLEFDLPETHDDVVVVSSNSDGLRHDVTHTKIVPLVDQLRETFSRDEKDHVELIIDADVTYQKVLGFGNALTGSVSFLLDKLTWQLRQHVYESIFSKSKGSGINFVRIPIGGCDFDLGPWSYNESPEDDLILSNFTKLDSRDLQKIRQIYEIRQRIDTHELNFFGSAWSSPKWMKTNNDWTGRSKLKPEYYQTWAEFHLKYLELMEESDVKFWGISTGNEPLNGELFWLFVRFMSLGWNAARQGTFVGDYLGPTIRNSKTMQDIKILANDDQRYTVAWWFEDMLKAHNKSLDYIDGLAVHWYWDEFIPASLLNDHHDKYPDKLIFNTEASVGDKPWESSTPILGSWSRAESYISAVMEDLKHWVNGWIDWNMLLNEQGGPNYVNNFVDAPIIVNSTDYKEIYKQAFYYAFGHFSRFITPNSTCVDLISPDKNVWAVAFKRTDGHMVAVVYNNKKTPVELTIIDKQKGKIMLSLTAKSIHSILYR